MKFALVVPQEFAEHYRAHSFEISGLLNWARALKGDIRTIHEDLTPYDVIMTNVSSTETEYVSVIKQMNPDAKIVVCFDYGFDVVNQYFLPGFEKRIGLIMGRADLLFSVNKNQVEWMRLVLRAAGHDKPVHYIPHPSDVESILKFRRPREHRTQGVGVMWHQYDNYQAQPLLVLKAVERNLKRKIMKSIIGLKTGKMLELGYKTLSARIPVVSTDHPDPKLHGKPIDPDMPKVVSRVPSGVAWDMAVPYLGVESWYSMLAGYEAVLDLYTVNSIGRFGIDAAGVGVPCVASDKQDSADLLWPFTTVDPFEPTRAIRFLTKLLSDGAFYAHVEKTALKNLSYYSLEASRARMMRVLGEK